MSGAHQAAVALHPLNGADRKWVLGSLPANERGMVQQLLDELDSLGFENADVLAVGEAPVKLDQPDEPEGLEGPDELDEPDDLRLLERADPEMLFRLLERESSALIVHLLAVRSWPWREAVLAKFPLGRRHHLGQLTEVATPPAWARDAYLVAAVASALRAATPKAPLEPPNGEGAAARLMHKVKKWIR